MKRLRSMAEEENPKNIISVGDTVSRNLTKNGFSPKLFIIDNKCMRKSAKPINLPADKTVYVRNPPGTITEEAEDTVRNALKEALSTQMIVDGEEDLLTLVAIVHAPEDSYVIYGQPYEGIVVVRVTPNKKAEISAMLKSMEKPSKS
jgi:uncharacterized protein (UPF0218 family)